MATPAKGCTEDVVCWLGRIKKLQAGRELLFTIVHNYRELLFTSLLFLATKRFFGLSTFSSESSALSDFLPGPYFTGLVQLPRTCFGIFIYNLY